MSSTTDADLLDHGKVIEGSRRETERPTVYVQPYGNASFFGALKQSDDYTHGNIAARGDGDSHAETILSVNIRRIDR